MLLVDYRAGSKELADPLTKLGLEVEVTELEFGDVAFSGKGAGGRSVDIGIEYKKLGEMISSIRDGRFSGHQLPGMVGAKGMYEYGWLLIEGDWRVDDDGFVSTLQLRRGRRPEWKRAPGAMRASEYEKHLLTYQLCGGCVVRQSRDQRDSIRIIADLYRWWTDRALDAHTSHLTQHKPTFLANVSEFRQAIQRWPGIGLKMSKAVEDLALAYRKRNDLTWVANQDVDWWAVVQTKDSKGNMRKFGEANARKLVNFLRGR